MAYEMSALKPKTVKPCFEGTSLPSMRESCQTMSAEPSGRAQGTLGQLWVVGPHVGLLEANLHALDVLIVFSVVIRFSRVLCSLGLRSSRGRIERFFYYIKCTHIVSGPTHQEVRTATLP